MEIRQKIVRNLRSGTPFIAYSLPGERKIFLVESSDPESVHVQICFFGKNSPGFRLSDAGSMGCQVFPSEATTEEEYAHSFSCIVNSLKINGGKTVLSRVIRLVADGGITWEHIIDNLFCKTDIHTFRFIYNMPETGIWLGASPELLLKKDMSGNISTMALAGTRSLEDVQSWDDKNTEEHQMVVDHIVNCFREAGLQPIVSDAQTVTHGTLQHLRHEITARSENAADADFESLLSSLNPTPALAGWPVDKSLERITMAEKHSRYCYGGYVSLTLSDGSKVAYVNLRSCHVSGDECYLYCGGGLTAKSELEAEWAETVLKSMAMRSVLGL